MYSTRCFQFVIAIYSICDNKHDIKILKINISLNEMWQIFYNLVERWF